MAGKNTIRRRKVDHSQELLYEEVVNQRSTRTVGPIPEFLRKKEAEREPKTAEWYRDSLMQFWRFMEERGLVTIGDLDGDAVNLFRLQLRKRGLADNTISNRLRAIRAFANWMKERGWTEEYALGDLQVPQSSKPQFDLITDERRLQVFDLYPHDTYLGSRNLAMLGVLSDTGLRREELVNLQRKNVDLDGMVVKVYSDKTEEWRYLPLTDEVVSLLRNYLRWRERYFAQSARFRATEGDDNHRQRKPRSIQSDRLFLTWDGRTLTPQSFGEILLRASHKIGARVHAHLFRHDWITRKALDGENPSVVKRWAGHKSYAMRECPVTLPAGCSPHGLARRPPAPPS